MYGYLERLFDPLAPTGIARPPDGVRAFFLHFLWPIKGLLLAILTISGIALISELALYAFLGIVVEWMASTGRETFMETYGIALVAMAIVAIVVRPIAVVISRGLINLALAPGLTNRVRWYSHRYLLHQSLSYFQNDFAGRIAQKVMQTGNALREAVINVIDGVWFLVIYLVGTTAIFIGLDWRLALPVVVWALSYAAVIVFLVPPVRGRSAATSEAASALTGRVVDSYTNIQSVKLFSHAEHEEDFAKEALKRHTLAYRGMMRLVVSLTIVLIVLNNALLLAMAVLSIRLWLDGSIGVGAIAAATGLVVRLVQMSGWILHTFAALFENVGMVQNGIETISHPLEVVDRPDARPLAVTDGEIRFDHIRFHYGKEAGAIEDVALTVRPGEKVGLVGRSGAGKSTLVNLLLRFHDLEGGRILIDGQDIATVTQESLREKIAMVTQDTSLLHRSIRDNISYGRPGASEAEILRAAELAEAHAFIPGLVDRRGRCGYDAHVGERGVKLSGGQRQRIAIARVILKDAPILVLDEATSSLDSEVEAAIQGQLQNLMEGKTVIAIAHRLSTIAALDRLVVMDHGRIVEEGSHRELLQTGGLYSQLWERQSGGFLGMEADVPPSGGGELEEMA